MIRARITAVLDRPVTRRRTFLTDLERAAVFLFAVEVFTGFLLALYYRPSPDGAFDSVLLISNSATFGWLVRSVHTTAAHALVAVAALVLARAFFCREFLRPGGRAWWGYAVSLFLVALAFFFTGTLLPWDEGAYWHTVVTTRLVESTPVAGAWLAEALRGGDAVGAATIVRLYAAHAIVLPWLAVACLLRARRARRRGTSR